MTVYGEKVRKKPTKGGKRGKITAPRPQTSPWEKDSIKKIIIIKENNKEPKNRRTEKSKVVLKNK